VRVSTPDAPSGVVTFLFTDVEGSTRRWEADADGMRMSLAAHDEVLRARSRRTAAGCSNTPETGCAPRSHLPRVLLMPRWPRSGRFSCRCGWAWRPASPSCAGPITSVRCSTVWLGGVDLLGLGRGGYGTYPLRSACSRFVRPACRPTFRRCGFWIPIPGTYGLRQRASSGARPRSWR
jgi:hypothetical protein